MDQVDASHLMASAHIAWAAGMASGVIVTQSADQDLMDYLDCRLPVPPSTIEDIGTVMQLSRPKATVRMLLDGHLFRYRVGDYGMRMADFQYVGKATLQKINDLLMGDFGRPLHKNHLTGRK